MNMDTIKSLGAIDYSAVIVFFIVLLGTGFYFFRLTSKSSEFFSGGRILPGWISGLSYYMTQFSAAAFIGGGSAAYRHGGWMLFWNPVASVLPVVLASFIAGRWQRTGVTTVPEFLNKRYGPSSRYLFGIIGLPVKIMDNGNRIYATAVFVGAALGIGKGLGLWGSSFIILMYTFMGGIWAVVATDVIQFFLMVLAVLLVGFLGIHFLGGTSNFIHNAPEGFWAIQPNEEFTAGLAIGIGIIHLINACGVWALVQRYTSTPTAWEARKVPLISASALLVVTPFLQMPAMMARQAIPEAIDGMVAAGMPLHLAAERSYILMCMKMLPAGIMGLVVVAIFAATMSALSSDYNILSAVSTRDIYQALIKKGREIKDKKLLWMGRYTTLGIALLCTLIGSQVDKMGGAFMYVWILLGLTSAPIYLPPIIGLLYKRAPAWGANLALFTGFTSGAVVKFGFSLPLIYMVLINTSVTVGTVLLSGLIDPIKGKRKEEVDALFERLKRPQERDIKDDDSPAKKKDSRGAEHINKVIAVGCLIFAGFLFVSAAVTFTQGGFVPNIICALGLTGVGTVLLVKPKKEA
jgi:SSS family transporter